MTVSAAITFSLTCRRAAACQRDAPARVAHAACHDDLTGLGNRRGFHAALAGAAGRTVAVILINLDGTRAFVSRHGDRALDQLLVLAAGRLQHVASASGGVGFRLRRDEFAVLLDELASAADEAVRLVAAVAEPTMVVLSGPAVTITVTVCAGVALVSPHTDTERRLTFMRADRAMRAAKQRGRGHTAMFDPAMLRRRDSSPAAGAGGGERR